MDDFVIGGWGDTSMVWYQHTDGGWKRRLISIGSHFAAGGAFHDIDDDGDCDIVQGGAGRSKGEVWLNTKGR